MPETASAIRAAIVGCGGAGRNHASGYRNAENAELVGVCDFDRERADDLASDYDVRAFYDLVEMLADCSPDVVSVATPERHHVEPTVTALEGGTDVFCEKIMADSVAGGRRMVEAAEATGQTLAVDYNYRHMPSFARIESGIGGGELGEVHLASLDVHAYGWHHALDLLAFLFGEPRSVRATLDHDPTVLDEQFRLGDLLYVPSHAVTATFEFPGGVLASVSSSIHTSLEDHLIDLAVYGDAGRVRLTEMTPEDSTGTVAAGPLQTELQGVESISLGESFERSIDAFVDAMAAGDEPPTTGRDGLRRLEVERAVVEAADTDGRVEL